MNQKYVKRLILTFIVIVVTILGLGQNLIYASTGITTKLSYFRYIKNESGVYEAKGGYALNTGTNHPVFQIFSGTGNSIEDTNLYCLNATKGATWTNSQIGTEVAYDAGYNLVDDKATIAGLDKVYSDVVNSEYYTQVMWILDNLYTGTSEEADIRGYLANAGIVYGTTGGSFNGEPVKNAYYYDETVNPDSVFSDTKSSLNNYMYGNVYGKGGYWYGNENDEIQNVIISKEIIEVVQQAAIWHFTNYLAENDSEYNCYTTSSQVNENNKNLQESERVAALPWLQYTNDTTNTNTLTWKLLSNEEITVKQKNSNGQLVDVTINVGAMKQEQAAVLYNYLVDEANAAAKNGYVSGSKGTIDLAYVNQKNTIVEDGENYKVGPMTISTTGKITGLEIETTTGTDTNITSSVNIVDTNGTAITKIKENTEFFVVVPKNIVNGSIKVTATGTYNSITKTLFIKSTGAEEQPIVQVTPATGNIDDSLTVTPEQPKLFDLALRKTITKITSKENTTKSLEILNESGLDATRKITTNLTTIPNTAEYYHRKDPVVVQTSNLITYEITIYNEGEVDGYASKIVDQLPTGLKSTLKTGEKVTSAKGNTYNVTYDEENNKVIFELETNTATNVKFLEAFDGTTLDSDKIEVTCEVVQEAATDGSTKHYLTNIAYIAEAYDENGNKILSDREGNESKVTETPQNTANSLNSTTADSYKGNSKNPSIYIDTNNEVYYEGQEDDDDFETLVLLPKDFDLKLVKYISEVNGDLSGKILTVDTTNLNKTINGKKITTADYDVSKAPISVNTGDYVKYTFRVYNEGQVDGYAKEITEDIPEGLKFVWDAGITVNPDGSLNFDNVTTELSKEDKEAIEYNASMLWNVKESGEDNTVKTISTSYLSKETSENNLIVAFDEANDNRKGSGLSYKEVSVMLKVISRESSKIIRNEAAITDDEDKNGKDVTDRDSIPENWDKTDSQDEYYQEDENYPKYEQDDEDYDNIKMARFDLALRKFIASVSGNGDFSNTQSTVIYDRAPEVNSTDLKSRKAETAIYNHSKDALSVSEGSYILYTIRVYNEGDVDGYAAEITDYLPDYLEFVNSTDEYISEINGKWQYDSATRKVTTTGLLNTILKAFDEANDDGKGSGLSYADIQIVCKVNSNAPSNQKLTNIAEISKYVDDNRYERLEDADSKSDNLEYPEDVPGYNGGKDSDKTDNYIPGQEDDDDFDTVKIARFDLALRKFITEISENEITTRLPEVSYNDGKIVYTHPKDVEKVLVGDVITYTLRVYNEGDLAGYAQKITDDIPEHLEYLPDNETNQNYRWVMYDKDGNETENVEEAVKVVSDYTSKEYGEVLMQEDDTLTENPNLLNAFDSSKEIAEMNPDYVDIRIAFKVKDPNSNEIVITNNAQISEDADINGDPAKDVDSTPDEWIDGEDDQDSENVSVEYFDLSLLKYVTEVIVTENGSTTTTQTKNDGEEDDIIPKVEIYRKSINSTKVKFGYTIKITNEGDIAGYAKEITDYVPEGLKFYSEDNQGWTDEGNNVISTKLLENTLLQPGESATVKVILRWENDEDNLGVKTNIAEISEDYNEKDVPDRDSTPDNQIEGEDDIDEAPVLLAISTGMLENVMMYVIGAAIILVVLGAGVIAIKKFVL